ncbi:MAG: ribosome silencing factor [Anaerolineales bacterium]|nr:ribosome silencing factor [Anaerolineales bacterium]
MVDCLEEKKGEDILLLDLIGVCTFTDYFVICTGSSERTIKALADEVRLKVKQSHSLSDQGVEGDSNSGWILIDYGDVVLHLFMQSVRNYYQLEELWQEGKVLVRVQ